MNVKTWQWRRWSRVLPAATGVLLAIFAANVPKAQAQEPPYFVTYSDVLEEPGNLEIAQKGATASPKNANAFYSATLEMEYGATAWWTTEVYLQGQATANDSTVFNGFRWENRFRPWQGQHFINPVIYIEYEDINQADKSFLEITGHDSISRLQVNNSQSKPLVERSMEGKLILSSYYKGWNVSENFIGEKNLSNEPWEFGYAAAVSRPLALAVGARPCVFCRQNFNVGAEIFGGLGTRDSFGTDQTSQYMGPTVDFNIPRGPTIGFSPEFGLNDNSVGTVWRVKVSYEIQQFRDFFRKGK